MKYLLPICALLIIASSSIAAPRSVREVDWKNFSYPLLDTYSAPEAVRWISPSTKGLISLINGRYVVPCSDDTVYCPFITLDSVNYGAVNGITSSVAVIVLTYQSGGTANWQYVYVLALDGSSKPRLLAWLVTGSRAYQGLREVSITGGDLILVVNDPDNQQGDCCSAGSIITRYRWVEGSFSAIGQPVHKIDPPSFDCAKAVTPVEHLICQDTELAYMDSQMTNSYQMVLKDASAERKVLVRRQQAEWFADYSRTCNALVSETQRRDCIDRYLTDRLTTIRK